MIVEQLSKNSSEAKTLQLKQEGILKTIFQKFDTYRNIQKEFDFYDKKK